LFDDFKLLRGSSAPAGLNTGEHFHLVRSY
jgi:hypothetical protein